MGYKSRYLIDDGSGTSWTDEESSNVTMTSTGTGSIVWELENNVSTYESKGPFKRGETGNPDGEDYGCNIGNSSTSLRLSGTPTSWDNSDFTIQLYFRPDSGSSTTANMVLFSTSENASASNSLHIMQNQSDIVVTQRISGGETTLVTATNAVTDHSESTWYYVVVTYEVSTTTLTLYTGNNQSSGIPDNPSSWSLTSGSNGSVTTATTFSNYIAGYDTIPGHNQFKGSFSILRILDEVITSDQRTNLYKYNALDATSYGDVHIRPLKGLSYDMHTIGYHKWLTDGKDMIINVETKYGKYKRWSKNDYVTKMFIKNGTDNILINTGFRGDPVEVVKYNNKNNSITYELTDLEFDKDAKNHCSECTFGSGDKELIKKHETERKHYFPKMVRNMISIVVKTDDNTFNIVIKNINKFNVQPAIISINPLNFTSYNKWSGFLIENDTKYHIDELVC